MQKSNLRKIEGLARLLENRYKVSGALLEDFRDLYELRNELTHPVHLPPGTSDNWPDYLRRIKDLGLLNTTGKPNGDYGLLGQIASHRLFKWAMMVTKRVIHGIVASERDRASFFESMLTNLESPWIPATDSDEEINLLLSLL